MTPKKMIEQANRARKAGAVLFLCVASVIAAPAQTFTTLFSFDGTNGDQAFAPLAEGFDGNLYGTTSSGGVNTGCGDAHGCGTVFEITPAGGLTTLYNFCSQPNCADGYTSDSALVQATSGNLYGTTYVGGANKSGTVFEMTPAGELTTLYAFCSRANCTDGNEPSGGLVQASNGNFYGTTAIGGYHNSGTVYEITPEGKLKTLHVFCTQSGCPDGNLPSGALVQAANGNFYGTTTYGGANNGCNGSCGTVFEITPTGALTTLYSFCSRSNCADGYGPLAGLIQAADGNFYGTTYYGGANVGSCFGFGCGTVFEITPTGTLTTLYSFCPQSNCMDGSYPYGGVVQASNGNFYGTTVAGGSSVGGCNGSGCGTIFEITPASNLTTLYNFCSQAGCTDGDTPNGGVLQSTDGIFYGATVSGGAAGCGSFGCGTVFSESVGLKPFVETTPTLGEVGARVIILGNDLESTTAVSFNGTAATFSVVSATEITATVPSGAMSGLVTVTTPARKLTSNKIFRVTP